MIYHHLYQNYGDGRPVRVGVVGAGNYGTAVVTQSPVIARLEVLAVADARVEAARAAFEKAGIDAARLVYCATLSRAEDEIARGNLVYTDHCEIVCTLSAVDVVCESTGNPEAAAAYALAAIDNGKHVAMCTKDCDVTVGPILKRRARAKGCVYTPVDGDQHGLLIQLCEWARLLGLEVLSGGKATDGEFVYDERRGAVSIHTDKPIHAPYRDTVPVSEQDRRYFEMIPPGAVADYIARRQEILAGLPQPGAYDLCEMTIAANYTGLLPERDTLWHAPLYITEIPLAYCPRGNGGIFGGSGVLDLATCLRAPREAGLGGGVFVVVRCDNAYSNHVLATKGQIANADGSASVIYRPYHLCGVETPISLITAGLLGLDSASDTYLPRCDLVKVAAEDIPAGAVFGNDHSPQLVARIVPAVTVAPGRPAPAHLLTGNRARVAISRGTLVTCDMVEEPVGSVLWRLRREQDLAFAT